MSIRVPVLLGLALAFPTVAFGACTKDPVPISLPIQRLDERLQDLAHLTGCMMQVDPSLLTDLSAPAISGNLTARQTLRQSLKGHHLRYRFSRDHWKITSTRRTDDHPIHDSFIQPW